MYENAVVPEGVQEKQRRPKLYFCKSKRYANFMLSHGSRMIQIQNDKFRPNYLVFVFLWDEVCEENAKLWENGERERYIG